MPWRALFLVGALALAVLAIVMIRSNLRTTTFLAAVANGDVETVKGVLEAEPGLVTTPVMPQGSRSTSGQIRWRGRLAMHQVVSGTEGSSVEMANMLAGFGADLGVRLEGDTLLHLAAAGGDLAMIAWLLDNGGDVNARNGCEHPAEALCSSGQFADWQPSDRRRASGTVCSGCDHEGQTPLHAAQRSIRAYESSLLLLSRGADVHATDAAGRSALHVAAQEASASQDQRVLCAYGADPAARDRQGKTPADLAGDAEAAPFSSSGSGELAGWLAPAGGCATLAARARPGAPVSPDDTDAAWREYVCTREQRYCQK